MYLGKPLFICSIQLYQKNKFHFHRNQKYYINFLDISNYYNILNLHKFIIFYLYLPEFILLISRIFFPSFTLTL